MNVNKDVFETKWEQIRAQSRMWWGLFSEDDLNKVEKAPIKRDKYDAAAGEIWIYPRTRQGGNQQAHYRSGSQSTERRSYARLAGSTSQFQGFKSPEKPGEKIQPVIH